MIMMSPTSVLVLWCAPRSWEYWQPVAVQASKMSKGLSGSSRARGTGAHLQEDAAVHRPLELLEAHRQVRQRLHRSNEIGLAPTAAHADGCRWVPAMTPSMATRTALVVALPIYRRWLLPLASRTALVVALPIYRRSIGEPRVQPDTLPSGIKQRQRQYAPGTGPRCRCPEGRDAPPGRCL